MFQSSPMQENMALKKSGTSKVQKFHTQYLTKEKREKSQTAAPGDLIGASSTRRSFARIKAELITFGSGLLDSLVYIEWYRSPI